MKIPVRFRSGKKLEGDAEELKKQVGDAYYDISTNLNKKSTIYIRDNDDPTTAETNFDIGTFWLNRDVSGSFANFHLYILVDIDKSVTPSSATWKTII